MKNILHQPIRNFFKRECPECYGYGVLECDLDVITGGDPGYSCPFCNGTGYQCRRLFGWKAVGFKDGTQKVMEKRIWTTK